MSMWDREGGGNFIFAPKVGGSIAVTIVDAIHRTNSDNAEFCYKKKGIGSMGYYDSIPVEEGKELLVNTWKLYFALKEANVDVSETIEIQHPSSGEYIINRIS